MLEKRPFAGHRFEISCLTFGGAAISGEGGGYGFGKMSEPECVRLLQYAFERGVNCFDTAPIYGFGLSEKRLGKAFKSIRDKVVLVSKCGVSWSSNKRVNMTNDPQVCQEMLEQSLRDLQTDTIDLYMVHWPDERVDIRQTMQVLSRAKEQGKIRSIGLCNTTVEELEKAREIETVDVVQSELNVLRPQVAEDLFAYLKRHEIDFMSWGTLDKGILSGRVTLDRKFDSEDCRSWAPWWKKIDLAERLAKVKIITELVQKQGYTSLELALAFNLSFKQLTTVICGARSVEQLDSLLQALEHLPGRDLIDMCVKSIQND